MLTLLLLALQLPVATSQPVKPFAPLAVYNGSWKVVAAHPWGGGAAGTVDLLESHCVARTAFFSCEQVINGKPSTLIVYVPGDKPGEFHTKIIYPNGLSANRGDMSISTENRDHWTYIDHGVNDGKPRISRTENIFSGQDSIHFEEYESTDEGKTWVKTNEGTESRVS